MLNTFRIALSKIRRKKKENYINNLVKNGLQLGTNVQIMEPFFLDPDHCFLISIGSNCTLAPNVRLIAHDASTKRHLGYTRMGKITIGDNCFIGDSTIILPNADVGNNSIVGAGSIVNKNIPCEVVAAGNPAKVICSIHDYLEKIRKRAEQQGILGEEYLIENLTSENRQKLLALVADKEGYIV